MMLCAIYIVVSILCPVLSFQLSCDFLKICANPSKARHSSELYSAEIDEGQSYFDWLKRKIELTQRPSPIMLPRAKIQRDFAVLLMRTSYAVADELDYIPMDRFQKEFFLFRQSEWQDFREQHPGIQQGDISDPNYFDFISFAQYATISNGMKRGEQIFTEKVGANGETQTVQRSAALADNELLPVEHARRVGDIILEYILKTFSGSSNFLPKLSIKPSLSVLTEGVERLMNIFRLNFYAVDSNVSSKVQKDGSNVLTVVVRAPATIWSQQVLALRKDNPKNDFEAKTIASYLNVCQVAYEYQTTFSGMEITHIFKLKNNDIA